MKQEPVVNSVSLDTRRAQILDLLERDGEQSIDGLAERFDVSGMTIRRDLQELAGDGKVIRTHGGAAPSQRISFEFRFLERARQQAKEKEQIADIATKLISPGDSVLLDSSTTTLAIARRLPAIGELTVVTTSLPIASELFGRAGIDVILLGGALRNDSPDLCGALTESNLDVIRADIAFIGVDAIDYEGHLYNRSPEVGRMLQQMARSADRVCAVADHTKIGRHELMRFADIRDWFALITDSGLDRVILKRLRKDKVKVFTPSDSARLH